MDTFNYLSYTQLPGKDAADQPPSVFHPGHRDIFPICAALCCLAANAGPISSVTVVLQDENTDLGWTKAMVVMALLDRSPPNFGLIENLHCADAYLQAGLSEKIAQDLASVPFHVTPGPYNWALDYAFTDLPPFPSACAQRVKDSMKEGCSQSQNIRNGTCHPNIENDTNLIRCTIYD